MDRLARRALARTGLYDAALRLLDAVERPLPFGRYHDELAFYRAILGPGGLTFDVGANLGRKTRLFLDAGTRVVAVEPQPSCVDRLRRAFGARDDVTIVPAAAAASEGEAELFLCDETTTISSMSKRFVSTARFAGSFRWGRTVMVRTTTLDALIERFGAPAYCKIDVEGYEASVLAGLSRPIPLVSFEFSRELLDEARACVRLLLGLGPFGFDCVLWKARSFLVGRWIGEEELFRRLADLGDPLLTGEIYARHPA